MCHPYGNVMFRLFQMNSRIQQIVIVAMASILVALLVVTAEARVVTFKEHSGQDPVEEKPRYRLLQYILDTLEDSLSRDRVGYSDDGPSSEEVGGSYNLDWKVPRAWKKTQSSVSKRKVFWQPLGYLPATMRGPDTGSQGVQNGDQSNGQIFRYG
jgi:hypothetical protein